MTTINHKINFTGLQILDRKNAGLVLDKDMDIPRIRVERIDISGTGLANGLDIVLLVDAGNTRGRYFLGKTGGPLNKDWIQAEELDPMFPFWFRIIFLNPGDSKIVASIDRIRPSNQGNQESLIHIECIDLGEQIWNLHLEGDYPTLQINKNVFPNAAGAETYLPFAAMVIPEVLKKCLMKICKKPDLLEDEGGHWAEWKNFIDDFDNKIPENDEEQEINDYINNCVGEFCNKNSFAKNMAALFAEGESENA